MRALLTRVRSLLRPWLALGSFLAATSCGSVGPVQSEPEPAGSPFGTPGQEPASGALAVPPVVADVPVTKPPYDAVHVNWKHRLDQPYVYVEHVGDYRRVGAVLRELIGRLDDAAVSPTGPYFCLYYDDPGRVPIESLRARICAPVAAGVSARGGLALDVLPSTTVAYAVVSGPVWQVPLCYPGVLDYMDARGWALDGPIRESYLNLDTLGSPDELLTEVQFPWQPYGR